MLSGQCGILTRSREFRQRKSHTINAWRSPSTYISRTALSDVGIVILIPTPQVS